MRPPSPRAFLFLGLVLLGVGAAVAGSGHGIGFASILLGAAIVTMHDQ